MWVQSWVRKILCRWELASGFLPGESHGQWRQVGHSRWGQRESNMTEQLSVPQHNLFSIILCSSIIANRKTKGPLISEISCFQNHPRSRWSRKSGSPQRQCLGSSYYFWDLREVFINLISKMEKQSNFYSLVSIREKAMAPHSSTLAWKIPWMEEPGRL